MNKAFLMNQLVPSSGPSDGPPRDVHHQLDGFPCSSTFCWYPEVRASSERTRGQVQRLFKTASMTQNTSSAFPSSHDFWAKKLMLGHTVTAGPSFSLHSRYPTGSRMHWALFWAPGLTQNLFRHPRNLCEALAASYHDG